MQNAVSLYSLSPPVVLMELIVAGVLGHHMVRDRAPVLVELHAHPNLVAIRRALVFLLVNEVGL